MFKRNALPSLFCCIGLLVPSEVLAAASVAESIAIAEQTHKQNIESQKRIDTLAVQTQHLLEEYQRILRNTDYQDSYNVELSQLIGEQDQEIAQLRQQLDQVKVTQEQIEPLMRSMADALEQFVVLDLPFHQQQRVEAVLQLKQRLRSPSLSLSNRFRLLWEAYQIESNYNLTIESWRGDVQLSADQSLSVEFVRIGRLGLYYLTLDRLQAAHWDRQTQSWQPIDADFTLQLSKAVRVANNQLAPQLLTLPVVKAVSIAEETN